MAERTESAAESTVTRDAEASLLDQILEDTTGD